MTKKEFLEILEKRLKSLSKSEIDDILSEYSQHIDSKVLEGKTESEAISDFGNIDELVLEILSAYNVDPDFKLKSAKNNISYYLSKFGEFINDIANTLLKLTPKELFMLILKFFILIVCLMIIRIPLQLFSSSFYNIFTFLPGFLFLPLERLIHSIFDLIYVIILAYVVFIFLKQNLLKDKKSEFTSEEKSFNFEERKKEQREIIKYIHVKNTNEKKENTALDAMGDILLVLIKILMFFFFVPAFVLTFCCVVALGIIFSMALQGYPLIGVSIILLGTLLCSASVTGILGNFIFKGEKKNEKISD